jgi:hypothetical protein
MFSREWQASGAGAYRGRFAAGKGSETTELRIKVFCAWLSSFGIFCLGIVGHLPIGDGEGIVDHYFLERRATERGNHMIGNPPAGL